MVAFGLGIKHSPTPNHSSLNLPTHKDLPHLILAETTTTTTTEIVTTITQKTTHFFSLPLWRKRGNATSVYTGRNRSQLEVDENDVMTQNIDSASFLVDKDLPPTPQDDPSCCESIQELKVRIDVDDIKAKGFRPELSIHLQPPSHDTLMSSKPVIPVSHSQITAVLAHAALGLGLPHVLPHASASSSASAINSVVFSGREETKSSSNVRKIRSSQKLRAISSSTELLTLDSEEDGRTRRRVRGLSLGTPAFFHSNMEEKGGKRKNIDDPDSVPSLPSPKTVTRRPSFWSRRKIRPSIEVVPSQPSPLGIHILPLPSVPISPFRMDIPVSSASPPPDQHVRGLSRSYSERASSRSAGEKVKDAPHCPSIPKYDVSHYHPPNPPSTADSSVRSLARSLFLGPTQSQYPSLAYVPSSVVLDPPYALNISPHRNRPRSQTNPTLNCLSPNLSHSFASQPYNTNGTCTKSTSFPLPQTEGVTNSSRSSLKRHPIKFPEPQTSDESPEVFINRLIVSVSKAEIAGILASSADSFHVQALRVYINQFDFIDDPLDVALRKLLMDVGLPQETQQIDRVIEAFASKYVQCNPTLFIVDDHAYILAFSLIMLHTDAFNKSNKRKMSKADYIRNTRLPGVPIEVLDYFYDNIVFAPFIFIEDPLDNHGQRVLIPDGLSSRMFSLTNQGVASTYLAKGNKVDPYFMIANNLLGPLRVNIEAYLPTTNPYSYEGTAGPWDEEVLQRAFAEANVIEIGAVDEQRASPFFSMSVSSAPAPTVGTIGAHAEIIPVSGEVLTLKVAKVGLINRKDDVLAGGRKAGNRKWKTWSAILTGSQLLLFRDPSWATALLTHPEMSKGNVVLQQASIFKPDELLSVKDAIAVYDNSYTKYEHTLRFVIPDGRQLLLQAPNEQEMNDWIARINYASAFNTAGVRTRSLGMSDEDVQLIGVAAATSHLHDVHLSQSPSQKPSWDGDSHKVLMDMLSGDGDSEIANPRPTRRITIFSRRGDMDLEAPIIAPGVEGADQFKTTFDQVKADLAAAHYASAANSSVISEEHGSRENKFSPPMSPYGKMGRHEHSRSLPRSEIIQSKLRELESRISAAQSQLDSDMRFLRNITALTPFQKSTRDRLQAAVHNAAKRITQVRLDTTKLTCHRDVLLNDLVVEDRNWRKAKKLALRAAEDALKTQFDTHIPRMTLSFHSDGTGSSSSHAILHQVNIPSTMTILSSRPESSICQSFHSAIDIRPDWPSSSNNIGSSALLNTSRIYDSPSHSSASLGSCTSDAHDGTPPNRKDSEFAVYSRTDKLQTPQKFYTAVEEEKYAVEQVEAWNKTRCAQRVSLVRVPSDIRMSTLFDMHKQQSNDNLIDA